MITRKPRPGRPYAVGGFDGMKIAMIDGYDGHVGHLRAVGGLNAEEGPLPQAQWAAADQMVAKAWAIHSDLSRRLSSKTFVSADVKGQAWNAHRQMGTMIQRWGERLEGLKHDPTYGTVARSEGRDPVAEWVAWMDDPRDGWEAWARQIDSSADYGSLLGAMREIGGGIMRDLGKTLTTMGRGWLSVLEWLPYIALGLGVGYVTLKIVNARRT